MNGNPIALFSDYVLGLTIWVLTALAAIGYTFARKALVFKGNAKIDIDYEMLVTRTFASTLSVMSIFILATKIDPKGGIELMFLTLGMVILFGIVVGNLKQKLDSFVLSPQTQPPEQVFLLPTTDHSFGTGSHRASGIVGERVAFGEVLYFKDDGKYWKADARSETTMRVRAMATETKEADQNSVLLIKGYVRDDSWNWKTAADLYANETAGSITQTRPSGSGKVLQVVGHAQTSSIIFFEPSDAWLTLA